MKKTVAVNQTEVYEYIDTLLEKIDSDATYKSTIFSEMSRSLGTGQKRSSQNEKDYQIVTKLVEKEFSGNIISDTSV